MDSKFNIEDMVPFVALEKLKTVIDIQNSAPEDILEAYSSLVWEFESAYHDTLEHGRLQWTGN